MNDLKSLLASLGAKGKAVDAPSTSVTVAAPMQNLVVAPESQPMTSRELDAITSGPIVSPKSQAQPVIVLDGGTFDATPVTEVPPIPTPATMISEMENLRREMYSAALAMKTAAEGLLRINSADYEAHSWKERADNTRYELEILYPSLKPPSKYDILYGGAKEPEVPTAYRVAENHGQVNPQAAVVSYDAPPSQSMWGRNPQK
jgi:hypothetical protein